MHTKVQAMPTGRKPIPIPIDFDPYEIAAVSAVKFGVSIPTALKWSRGMMRAGTNQSTEI